jgi:hypothetical protein
MPVPPGQQRASKDRVGGSAPARRGLSPPDPMSGWLAVVQVVLLLGIPIGLLLLAKVILVKFFPGLGY